MARSKSDRRIEILDSGSHWRRAKIRGGPSLRDGMPAANSAAVNASNNESSFPLQKFTGPLDRTSGVSRDSTSAAKQDSQRVTSPRYSDLQSGQNIDRQLSEMDFEGQYSSGPALQRDPGNA